MLKISDVIRLIVMLTGILLVLNDIGNSYNMPNEQAIIDYTNSENN